MEEQKTTETRKGKNWSPDELLKVCRAFFTVSEDPVKGANHKGDAFNEAVFVVFERIMGGPGTSGRNTLSLRNKRYQIMRSMGKFIGCYNRLKGKNNGQGPSGWSEADYLQHAKARYKDEMKAANEKKIVFEFDDIFRLTKEYNKFHLFDMAADPKPRPMGTQKAKREMFAENKASDGAAGAEKKQKLTHTVEQNGLSAKAILTKRNKLKELDLAQRKLQLTMLLFSDKSAPPEDRKEMMQHLRADAMKELHARAAAKTLRAQGEGDHDAANGGVHEPLAEITNVEE